MSRIAFACLTAMTFSTAGSALAQTPAPPAAPAAPAAAPMGPAAPMAPGPMAPMAPAPMTPAPMTPAAPVAAPAAPMAAAPAAAAAAPAAPIAPAPDSVAARALQVLDQVCLPMIRQPGSDPKTFAKALGLRKAREFNTWTMKLDKVNSIAVRMPSANNVSTCDLTVNYDVGQGPAIIAALSAWAAAQPAPLQQDKAADPYTIDNIVYTTTNWVSYTASTRMGVAFTEQKKADGSPVGRGSDQATVSLSFRALSDQDRTAQ